MGLEGAERRHGGLVVDRALGLGPVEEKDQAQDHVAHGQRGPIVPGLLPEIGPEVQHRV